MSRDSGGAILCTAEELFEQVEGRGDVGGFVEFHEGVKELLGTGVMVSDGDMVRSLGELEVSSENNWGALRDVQDRVKLSIGCYR